MGQPSAGHRRDRDRRGRSSSSLPTKNVFCTDALRAPGPEVGRSVGAYLHEATAGMWPTWA